MKSPFNFYFKKEQEMKYFKENDKTPFILISFGIGLYFILNHISFVLNGISYAASAAFPCGTKWKPALL